MNNIKDKKKKAFLLVSKSDNELFVHYESVYAPFSKRYLTHGKYVLKRFHTGACVFDLEQAKAMISEQKEVELEMIDITNILNKAKNGLKHFGL